MSKYECPTCGGNVALCSCAPVSEPYTTDAAGRTILDSEHPFRGAQPTADNYQPGKSPGEKSADPREWLYGAEHWVPEDHMFKSGYKCLEAFPDAGPACGVVSGTTYEALKAERDDLRAEVERLSRRLKVWDSFGIHDERDVARQDYADCHADLQSIAKDCDRYREALAPKVGANQPTAAYEVERDVSSDDEIWGGV